MQPITAASVLPLDVSRALLVGRVWRDGHTNGYGAGNKIAGPCVVVVRQGQVVDISTVVPTVADLFDRDDMLDLVRYAQGEALGSVHALMEAVLHGTSLPSGESIRLLAPCDVQAIKACGVTFAVSLLERVIEEQAGGNAARALELRAALGASLGAGIGHDLSAIRPGSPAAMQLKQALIARGAWSMYMEVGIGPDAEVFSKSQPMSAVGFGADVGLHPDSLWNNPEPEIVLAINSATTVVGATLGNDVNLRDIEGRSALLLGKAKDNNGSCAIGPFIRLFDDEFTLDTIRATQVNLLIEGQDDDFRLDGVSFMREISRDPLELVRQVSGRHHQYPDGFMLFLGTMFSPIKDRDAVGAGFTHHLGDRVTISTECLGALVNQVQRSDAIPPWTFGVRALYHNLMQRGLLASGSSFTAAPISAPPLTCTPVETTRLSHHASYPDLAHKRVVITGGGTGIGAAMVAAFAQQGAQVFFLDIADDASQQLATSLIAMPYPPRFFHCDLRDLDALSATFAQIAQDAGTVDILINNAANDDRHDVATVSPAYWDQRMEVNLRHQFFCAQAVVPGMQSAGCGVILNLGSISWHLALPNLSLYMTAKAAIEGLTRGLARDLGGFGIRVNTIVPGAVRTLRQTLLWQGPEEEAKTLAAQCLHQRIEPEDVAALALFLASDNAACCTGRDYFVDAGWYGA